MFAGMSFELKVIYSKKPSYIRHVRVLYLRVVGDFTVKTVDGWTYSSFISGYETLFRFSGWDGIPDWMVRSYANLRNHVPDLPIMPDGFASSVVEMMRQAFEWDRCYLLSNLMHYQMFTTSAGLVRNSSYRSVHFGCHSSSIKSLADPPVMSDRDLLSMIIDSPRGPVEISGSVKSLMACRPMIDADLMRMLEES